MKPVLFTIPGIDWDVPGYGVMLMIGFLLATWWAVRRSLRSGANPDVILNLGFVALIAGVVGCRAMYVVHYWEQFGHIEPLGARIWAILDVRRGGLEFYGGFILACIAGYLWLRYVEKVSLRWYLDIVAPSAALGLAIGRIGCFLNGCCFGHVSDVPWAVRFPFGSNAQRTQWEQVVPGSELPAPLLYTFPGGLTAPIARESIAAPDERLRRLDQQQLAIAREIERIDEALDKNPGDVERATLLGRKRQLQLQAAGLSRFIDIRTNARKYGLTYDQIRALAAQHRSLPVHPTQLYSTVTALIIALLLSALYWRRSFDGQVIATLLLIEPVSRWLLEVIRADNPVDTLGLLTISQFLALAMTLVGLGLLLYLRRLPPRSPRAAIWQPEPASA